MDTAGYGMLITIEGIDGCGKSTLMGGLEAALTDIDPLFTREPGSTWIGDQVRRGIAEEIDPIAEALLFVADHAAHLAEVIRPALADHRLVISDRYSDSRYAYQQVTLAPLFPEPLLWLRSVHGTWTIRPDRTYLMTIPIADALERLDGKDGREHFERAEVLEQVQKNYLALAEEDPQRFVLVDALQEREKICSFIAGDIRNLWQS